MVEITSFQPVRQLPRIERLTEVFGAGQAWSMYGDGEDYWLALNPPAFEEPLWVARIDRSFTSVVVHCGEGFVSHRDGEVW